MDGICRMFSAASEQPHLSSEISALSSKTCSRLSMVEEVLDRAIAFVQQVPAPSALLLLPYTNLAWRVLIDALPVGVVVYDGERLMPRVNKLLLEMVGLDSEIEVEPYLAGSGNAMHFYHVDGRRLEAGESPVERLMRGESLCGLLYKLVNHKGIEYIVLLSGGRADPEDPDSPLLLTALDVTETARLERSKEALIQVFNHEIRNPLQVMKGLIEVARLKSGRVRSRAVGKCLDSLEEQVHRLSRFMDYVSDAYPETVPAGNEGRSRVDFCHVVSEAVIPHLGDPVGHKMVMSLPDDPVDVVGDARRLSQLLANLLSNAVKYSPGGSTIRVTVASDGKSALAKVEDEGWGIAPSELEEVFNPFYRPKDLSTWPAEGAGLGLFLSRRIARRHGGDLWAENRPEGGSVLLLRLPLASR